MLRVLIFLYETNVYRSLKCNNNLKKVTPLLIYLCVLSNDERNFIAIFNKIYYWELKLYKKKQPKCDKKYTISRSYKYQLLMFNMGLICNLCKYMNGNLNSRVTSQHIYDVSIHMYMRRFD